MNWTKQSIIKAIEESELGIEMAAKILEAIKQVEHYKKVDKRFIDLLKEFGFHAYIQRDNYSTTLSVSNYKDWHGPKAEFRLYVSHVMSKSEITWDKIKEEIERYNYAERLQDAKDRLEVIEKETEEAKELLEMIKSKKFKCFDFYKSIYEIQDAVKAASS